METYQEEYRKIRREYTRLEKMTVDKGLPEVERDEAQAMMAQISGRMNFLRPHVEESARRIDELTDLRNDITVGRSRLDKATEIIRKYTDISDMTDEELKSINENLYQITNGEDFKHLKRENIPSVVAGLKAEYDDKAESFHNLYRQYEEFEEDFKKKDPQYVEKKDDLDKSKDKGTLEPEGTEAPKQENIETPEEKVDTRHPFNDDLMKKEFDLIKSNYKNEIEDVLYVKSADICAWGELLKQNGYQASVWLTGSDEYKIYKSMSMNVEKYEEHNRDNRDFKDACSKSFYVEEIERSENSDFISGISGTKVRQSLLDNDKELISLCE